MADTPEDPDAAFRAEVAAYQALDPLRTIRGMSANLGIPEAELVQYVLAKWATAGSEGLLHLGGVAVERMWGICEAAEGAGADAKLAAFDQLRSIVSWLRVPLVTPDAYE
ncbi:MAG: DUF6027 family protein [Acidimicrobiales bacterium]